jgi:hypothetical protein
MSSGSVEQIKIRAACSGVEPLILKRWSPGVLPSPAAIASGVEDALSPFRIRIRQFPIRPRDLSVLLETAGVS